MNENAVTRKENLACWGQRRDETVECFVIGWYYSEPRASVIRLGVSMADCLHAALDVDSETWQGQVPSPWMCTR
jgi:hypothetical protein